MPWLRVTRQNRCPICDKPDWCKVTEDGQMAFCMRIESSDPVESGGWIHKVSDPIPVPKARKEPQSQSISNFALYRDMNKMPVNHPKLYRLAVKLGLPAVSLLAIEAGWNGKNYTIPMYNGNCECVGIRLRSQNGMKFAVRGSKNGLFIPLTGVYPDCYDTLYVVEGPTDTAAMYAMKLPAIGRPDCNSGVEYLKQFLGCKRRDVIIIADRDKPQDATQRPPGLKGAYRAAKAIKPLVRGVKIVLPPVYKDVRQWYHAGCIKEAIIAVAKNTGWIK